MCPEGQLEFIVEIMIMDGFNLIQQALPNSVHNIPIRMRLGVKGVGIKWPSMHQVWVSMLRFKILHKAVG
jgi:hypothetical protein